jgi:two-component system, OmpR family, sensor histidine kinase KdpD
VEGSVTVAVPVVLGAVAAVASVVAMLAMVAGRSRRAAERRAAEVVALAEEAARVQREQDRLASEKSTLEQAREAQRALLRSVSHDLRTPLAAIRAVASDLRAAPTAYDEATRRELLDVVGDEAERLDRLVGNLLSLSRIEAGALTPDRQAVDVEELVVERVRRLSRLLRDVAVETELPPGIPLVDADYTLLDQVVSNLLENAARHAPSRSTVRIAARDTGGTLEISVSDQGPGVAPVDRDWIFEPFRSGNGSRSSGVGLAICKAVVEAHGGHIAVGEADGGGARFTFTLPLHWVRPQPDVMAARVS